MALIDADAIVSASNVVVDAAVDWMRWQDSQTVLLLKREESALYEAAEVVDDVLSSTVGSRE